MKIVTISKSMESAQLMAEIVERNNYASNKSVNNASPTIYLIQIPKQKKKTDAMVVIKLAYLK